MANGSKPGIATALELTGAGEPPREDAEQLALLPSLAEKPHLGGQETESGDDAPRRGGRPKGARNKRTVEMVRYLESRYGPPLERLAQLYSADPKELARQHHIKVKDALALMKDAAVAALPYMHQKQPVSVDVEGKGTFQLIVGQVADAELEQAEDGFSVVLDLAVETPDKSEA